MSEIPVSVIVVNFNTKQWLKRCLQSVADVSEVIVVDNASSDGSGEMVERDFPGVTLIKSTTNLGFGPANNRGLDVAKHELVLLLNSDAAAHRGAVLELAARFSDPNVVAAGGRLLSPDGSIQRSCADRLTIWRVLCEQLMLDRLCPGSRLTNGYWLTQWVDPDVDSPVAQVMGACLMMRNIVRFDERMALYCEDTELCHRLVEHGQILYVPVAMFDHELGASSKYQRAWSVAMYNRGKEQYFLIHHGRASAVLVWVLNRVGALVRFFGWSVVQILSFGTRGRGQAKLFWRVLWAPICGPTLDRTI